MEDNVEDHNLERKSSEKDYRRCCKYMKATVKSLVFENAALCKEIQSVDHRLASAKSERKALLKRLLQFEKPESKTIKTASKKSHSNSGVKVGVKTAADETQADVSAKKIKTENPA